MSDEYVKKEEIIETRWKCPSCQAVNRGRDMKCPTCGAPKDESSEYEVDANAEAVTDAEAVADANAGEHWICAFCEKENRGRKKICQFCGADQTTRDRKNVKAAAPKTPEKKPNYLLGCGVLLAGLFVVLAFLYWLGSPRKVEAKVVATAWTQELQLRTRTQVEKENWASEVPAGAFDSRCDRRQRTTRQVVDHYTTVTKTRRVKYQSGSHEDCRTETENTGNGYAKRRQVCKNVPEYDYRSETYTDRDPVYRTEPVMEDFCHYALWEWPVTKTARREGTGTTGLAWAPESELGVSGCEPCDTAQKGASAQQCCAKEAHYRVTFENPKKPEEKPIYESPTPEEFATFSIGQQRALEIDDDKVSLAKEE